MKTAIVFGILAMVLIIPPLQAGGRHYDSGRHHSHHWRGHGKHHYYGKRHHSRHRHHGHNGAYLVGGIILGSLLSRSYERQYHYYPSRTVTHVVYRQPVSETVIVDESAVVETEPVVEHILLRDKAGNCFSVTERDDGTEVRTEIDANACLVE